MKGFLFIFRMGVANNEVHPSPETKAGINEKLAGMGALLRLKIN